MLPLCCPTDGLWIVERRLRELFELGRFSALCNDFDKSLEGGATEISGFFAGVGDCSTIPGDGSGEDRIATDGTGETDSERSDTGDIE